jgi:hypothetical protein
MYKEEDCGCEHHGEHHGEREEGHSEDCGCGGHGHHDMHRAWGHHSGCSCGYHRHEGMGFRRHFIPREEIIARLEGYLKQLQAEAKGVEERIAELKTKGEPK